MSVNINDFQKKHKAKTDRPLIPADNHLALLVKVVDLGLQPRPPYKGEEKPPAYQVELTFEFPDVTMEYQGEQRPMHLSKLITMSSFSESNCVKIYNALDPSGEAKGDFGKCIGNAVLAQVIHDKGKGKYEGQVFDKIAMVSTLPSAMAKLVPELNGEPILFSMDNPDLDMFDRLPTFRQDQIKRALNFEGSRLEKALRARETGDAPEATATAPMEEGIPNVENVAAESTEFDDDIPW